MFVILTVKGDSIMGTFKKIPERFKKIKMRSSYNGKTIIKEVRLFEPTHDEQVRKKEGLWIPHRKRTYLYWYKFLQARRYLGLKIKGQKYKGWDLDTILETSFDEWWELHWRDLFATKKKGQEPKFTLSTKKVRYESIRFSYFVGSFGRNIQPIVPINKQYLWSKETHRQSYKNMMKSYSHFSNAKIGYVCVNYELQRRYPTNSNLFYPVDNDYKPIKWNKLDSEQTRSVGQEVSRHKGNYEKILKNVAKGDFP